MRRLVPTLILIAVTCSAAVARGAETAPPRSDNHASVIVFSRGFSGTSCGNGFAVGDGTLVVTARHIVFPERLHSLQQGDALVTVFSPCLGDAAEAEVLAQDRALDAIVLRVHWKGHPALPLADDAAIVAADKVGLAGYPGAIAAVTAGKPQLLQPPLTLETAPLQVSSVIVGQGATRNLFTLTPPTGGGWPGAPMMLVGPPAVAGCYTRTGANGTTGVAVASGQLRALIEQGGATSALNHLARSPALPADSPAATSSYLRSIAASSSGDAESSMAGLEAFLQLRPGSAIGYRELAGQAWATKDLDRAQTLYARALEIDPALVSARVLYGQLLHDRLLPDHAMEHLRYVWDHGGSMRNTAVIPMCNLLREQRKEQECTDLLTAAVKEHPEDGYLWDYLGQSRSVLVDHPGAAAAFQHAAELMPDNESLRLKAGEEFLAAGKRDQAEGQYRGAIAQHPQSPSAYYALARLLAQDTARREEALDASRLALNFADRPGAPPKSMIQSLISAIRAGRASPVAEFKL